MAKILILMGGHLCNGPRPCKEADALAAAGHDVMVAGVWFDRQFVQRDYVLLKTKSWQFYPILDFRGITLLQTCQRGLIRLQAKLAQQLFVKANLLSLPLLGYGARAMLRFAQQYRADLTIVHSEVGLWVGRKLQQQGYQVGVDFEDWFSEDLLPAAKANRPITWIKTLEAELARHCRYCLTTSQAMATAMATAYACAEPTVIYNAFPRSDRPQIWDSPIWNSLAWDYTVRDYLVRDCPAWDHPVRGYQDRHNLSVPSLHWFSQTIGPGRGLETLLAALPQVQAPVEIHLRGNCPGGYRDWLMALVPDGWQDRIFLHETVDNHHLPARIAEHDMGLALETPQIPSRNLTVTNKLFQYLEAGLAVIATDTAGQREVLQQHPQAGHLIPANDPIALAQVINHWMRHPDELWQAKQAAKQASVELSWETQAEKLVHQAQRALAGSKHDPISVEGWFSTVASTRRSKSDAVNPQL